MSNKTLLTAGQLAERWCISAPTVRRWWHAGIIPSPTRNFEGALRWRLTDIEKFEQEAVAESSDCQEARDER